MPNSTRFNPRWIDEVGESAIRADEPDDVEDDEPRPCSVYYLHNSDHELLYVGISTTTMMRLSQHEASKPWWPEVAYASIEHLPTVAHARQREAAAIQGLNPRYNIVRPGIDPCKNCGSTEWSRYRKMCELCYKYKSRTGKTRPAELFDSAPMHGVI